MRQAKSAMKTGRLTITTSPMLVYKKMNRLVVTACALRTQARIHKSTDNEDAQKQETVRWLKMKLTPECKHVSSCCTQHWHRLLPGNIPVCIYTITLLRPQAWGRPWRPGGLLWAGALQGRGSEVQKTVEVKEAPRALWRRKGRGKMCFRWGFGGGIVFWWLKAFKQSTVKPWLGKCERSLVKMDQEDASV